MQLTKDASCIFLPLLGSQKGPQFTAGLWSLLVTLGHNTVTCGYTTVCSPVAPGWPSRDEPPKNWLGVASFRQKVGYPTALSRSLAGWCLGDKSDLVTRPCNASQPSHTPSKMVRKNNQGMPLQEPGNVPKKRGKAKRNNSLKLYLKKLVKNRSGDLQITVGSAEYLELLCDSLLKKVTTRAMRVMELRKSKTLSATAVQAAVKLEFPPGLAEMADNKAVKCVEALMANN